MSEPSSLFISAHELISSQYQPSWLIKNYLEEQSISLLYGSSGGGKSFLALDWACCVATGKAWHNHKIKQGKVLYIAGEGRSGLAGRLKAWQIHHQMAVPAENLIISKSSFNIDTAEDVLKITDALPNTQFSLVIIDTLNRNFTGDENLARDIRNYIKGCEYLRNHFQACILTVHHSGLTSDKRPRGSSALYAAMDSSYQLVEGQQGVRALVNDKLKDGTPPKDMNFELEIVSIADWTDDDGLPYASCVLRTTYKDLKESDTSRDSNVMLELIFNAGGNISKSDLRFAFYEYKLGTANAKRSAFNRTLKSLISYGIFQQETDEFGIEVIKVPDEKLPNKRTSESPN